MRTEKLEYDYSREKSKLVFDCEEARFKMQHAQKQLDQAIAEKNDAMDYVERIKEKDQELPLNMQTIQTLRQKVPHLEVELAKALRESKLLESLQQIEEGNVPAASLMNFLSFIFQVRPQLED